MPTEIDGAPGEQAERQSYKYQRLRERLRGAILSKELHGKLPGERELARQFKVNAKTLGKALTDLAAEGLLERTLGVGTFVKGSIPLKSNQQVLLLTDPFPTPLDHAMVEYLRAKDVPVDLSPADHAYSNAKLTTVRRVVLTASTVPGARVRDLIVRRKHVVALDCHAGTVSTHAVCVDRDRQIDLLVRDLLRQGYKRFWVSPSAYEPLAKAVARSLHDALQIEIDSHELILTDPARVKEHAASVVICGFHFEAQKLIESLKQLHLSVPSEVGVAHVGAAPDDSSISGFCVTHSQLVAEMSDFMDITHSAKPVTLWLQGRRTAGKTLRDHVNHGK